MAGSSVVDRTPDVREVRLEEADADRGLDRGEPRRERVDVTAE